MRKFNCFWIFSKPQVPLKEKHVYQNQSCNKELFGSCSQTSLQNSTSILSFKVKVVPYASVRRTLILGHRHMTYGGQLRSSPPLSLKRFHYASIRCWVNSERAFSEGVESGSERNYYTNKLRNNMKKLSCMCG